MDSLTLMITIEDSYIFVDSR